MLPIFRIISRILPVLLVLQPSPTFAANLALMELLKALYENDTIDNKTYQLVKTVAEQENETNNKSVSPELNEQVDKIVESKITEINKNKRNVTINTKGKFEVASNEGDFKFRLGGRIQMDAATYAEDGIRHNDGTELRRVRLFAQGTLWQNWDYKLQYDFTGSGINGLQDAYIDYSGSKPFSVRVGHIKEPFGLQNMTSSKYVAFTERALISAFSPGRNIGIQLGSYGDNWSLYTGLYSQGRDGALADGLLDHLDGDGVTDMAQAGMAPAWQALAALLDHLGSS